MNTMTLSFNTYPNMSGARISRIIVEIIDQYMDQGIGVEEARTAIESVLYTSKNRLKIRKNRSYTATFLHEMGKKRIETFEQLYRFPKGNCYIDFPRAN